MSETPRLDNPPQAALDCLERWLGEPYTLPAVYLADLLPGVARLGLDPQAWLRTFGLDEAALRRAGARISLARALALLEWLQHESADPLAGLALAVQVRPRSYPFLGYAAMSCATLEDAIERLIRYEPLVWGLGRVQLVPEDAGARLSWQPKSAQALPLAAIELALAGWLHLGRQLLEGEGGVRELCFAHPARDRGERYEALLAVPVRFGQDWNGVRLDDELLRRPLRHADPALCRMMDEEALALLENYRRQVALAGEVRAWIRRELGAGEPSLEQAAAALDLSPKMVSRGLAEQGTSFVALVDEVRHDLALVYLRRADPLLDIAGRLGFSEQSAFTRAFKRWTGTTPGQYRQWLESHRE